MLEVVLQYLFSETKEMNDVRKCINIPSLGTPDFIGEYLFVDNLFKYLYKIDSGHENWLFNKKIDGIRGILHAVEERMNEDVRHIKAVLSKRNDIFFSSGKKTYVSQWEVVLSTYIAVFYSNGYKILEHLHLFLLYSNGYFSIEDVTNSIKKAEIDMNLPHTSLTQEWKYLLSLQTPRKI